VINRLLLGTHVALWLDSDDHRLRPSTRSLIDGCWQSKRRAITTAAFD